MGLSTTSPEYGAPERSDPLKEAQGIVAYHLRGTNLPGRLLVPDPDQGGSRKSHTRSRGRLPGCRLPTQSCSSPVMLEPDTGPDTLLRVLPELAGDWVTVFAGAARAVGEAEAEACRRALPDPGRLVTRFGYVPEAETDRYFRAADVLILPYRKTFKGTGGILDQPPASA
jgi:hypothetical protein